VVGVSLPSDAGTLTLGEDEDALTLAQAVWEDDGAPQLLIGVAGVQGSP
jgi:hypothetical protein